MGRSVWGRERPGNHHNREASQCQGLEIRIILWLLSFQRQARFPAKCNLSCQMAVGWVQVPSAVMFTPQLVSFIAHLGLFMLPPGLSPQQLSICQLLYSLCTKIDHLYHLRLKVRRLEWPSSYDVVFLGTTDLRKQLQPTLSLWS